MLLKEFNQIVQQYNDQIKKLQSEKDDFIAQNEESVLLAIEKRKAENRKWFIDNFDKIWKFRKLFALGTKNASIVVDFWTIHLYSRCSCGFAFNKISLGRLIKLWELGFMYDNCPVVEYVNTSVEQSVSYIKNNQLHKQKIKSHFFPETVMKQLNHKKFENNVFADYRTIDELKKYIERQTLLTI